MRVPPAASAAFLVITIYCTGGNGQDDPQFLLDAEESEVTVSNANMLQNTSNVTYDVMTPPCPYTYCGRVENLSVFESSWFEDPAFLPTAIVYGIAFFLGVTGNILVIFALAGDRKAHNVTSSFLISLAVADLAFLLFCVPYEVGVELKADWLAGAWLCKFAEFMEMLTACASVLNLTAISIERYVVIVHPMKSRSLCTMGKMRKIIIAVWLLSALLSSPELYTKTNAVAKYYNDERHVLMFSCEAHNLSTQLARIMMAWYKLLVIFLLPLLAMLFCYSFVIHVLWLSNKQLAKLTHANSAIEDDTKQRLTPPGHNKTVLCRPTNDNSSEVREAREQVIKMLITVIAVFFLCWGPELIAGILKSHQLFMSNDAFYARLVIGLLPYLQSCSNPLIYSFMSKNFRRSMQSACRTRCRPCERLLYRPPKAHEYDLDTKTNGASFTSQTRYSPSMSSSRPGKTLYSVIVSEAK